MSVVMVGVEVRGAVLTLVIINGKAAKQHGCCHRAVSYTHLDVYKRQV